MIEYIVVLAFGVIVLIKPFSYDDVTNPNAAATEAPALQQVAKAIRDYHEHYTYAMSIAYIPDCDYTKGVDQEVDTFLGTIAGGASVTIDRCIDWTNPQFPAFSFSGTMNFDFASNVEDAITTAIKDSIESSISGFLDPSSLLSDMVGFNPSDFF